MFFVPLALGIVLASGRKVGPLAVIVSSFVCLVIFLLLLFPNPFIALLLMAAAVAGYFVWRYFDRRV